jgi:hypothetical protein
VEFEVAIGRDGAGSIERERARRGVTKRTAAGPSVPALPGAALTGASALTSALTAASTQSAPAGSSASLTGAALSAARGAVAPAFTASGLAAGLAAGAPRDKRNQNEKPERFS